MSDIFKKVMRKIKRVPQRQDTPQRIALVLKQAEEYSAAFWERDKKTQRTHAFKKAQIRLKEYRESVRIEKERQDTIAEQRLKNLKKARKAKEKNNEQSA
jgi:hypothetical protein